MAELSKARWVGAGIYLAAALVLIPWLFSDPVDPRSTIRSRFESDSQQRVVRPQRTGIENGKQSSAVPARSAFPVAKTSQAEPVATPKSKPTQTRVAPSHKQAPVKPTSLPKKTDARTSQNPTPSSKAPTTKGSAPQWRIQLASYTQQASAERFVKTLRKDGFAPQVIGAQAKGRRVWRVSLEFAGNAAEVKKLQSQLDKRYKLKSALYKL